MKRNHNETHTPNAPFSGERLRLSAFPFQSLSGTREAIWPGCRNAPWPPLSNLEERMDDGESL
jgi:hypothetical protein